MPKLTGICVVCGEGMQVGATSAPPERRAHNKCRSKLPSQRKHGDSGYHEGCRCDTCRSGHVEHMRAYIAKKRAQDGVTPSTGYRRSRRGVDPTVTVECVRCGNPLRYIRTQQVARPMHKKCRMSAPEWMRKGWPNPKIEAFRRKIEKAALGTSGGNRIFVNGPCSWCGGEFTALGGRYCSDSCKKSAAFKRRSSGNSFSISPRERAAIYERDSWTCQLCFYPIEQGLHYLNDWAPSLDHIIPQSMMLIPDHSPSNLRMVHRWCNSARGDGSNMTEAEFHARIAVIFAEVAA